MCTNFHVPKCFIDRGISTADASTTMAGTNAPATGKHRITFTQICRHQYLRLPLLYHHSWYSKYNKIMCSNVHVLECFMPTEPCADFETKETSAIATAETLPSPPHAPTSQANAPTSQADAPAPGKIQ